MTDFHQKGDDPTTAWEKAKGQYGRVDDAVKIIDPESRVSTRRKRKDGFI
jgi:hypothetical protein